MLGVIFSILAFGFFLAQNQDVACPEWQTKDSGFWDEVSREILAETNLIRKENCVEELKPDPGLAKVASTYALFLGTRHILRHEGPRGESVESRLRDAGIIDWDRVGENLEWQTVYRSRSYHEDGRLFVASCYTPQEMAKEIVHNWMESEGHRQNLLDPNFTHMGLGIYMEQKLEALYVVQIYYRKVDCGYFRGPCCLNVKQPSVRLCQVPLHCVDETCQ